MKLLREMTWSIKHKKLGDFLSLQLCFPLDSGADEQIYIHLLLTFLYPVSITYPF